VSRQLRHSVAPPGTETLIHTVDDVLPQWLPFVGADPFFLWE
jgi:hypothetical protein